MAQTSWTDPRGQQHQYTTPGGGLRGGTRNALERQRTWRAIDPSFDTSKYQVGPTGKISDVTSTGDLFGMGALALSAPLVAAYLPGLLGGAAGASGAGAAGGGSQAGLLAGGAIPGWSAAGMAGPGAIASQGVTAGLAGGLGSVLPAAAGGAAAAAADGFLGKLKSQFTDPSNMVDLAGIITALVGASRGGGGQTSPEAQRMQQMTEARMRRVDPLHQAITQLAWGRLPTNARSGIAPPTNSPLP